MLRTMIFSAGILAVAVGAAPTDSKKQPEPRLRLVSQRTHDHYLSFWPKSNDAWLNNLKKQDLIFYNDEVMPAAYQDWDGALQGLHSPSYNISAVRSEPIGNANREFPWGSPAGLHRSSNHKAFRFAYFPKGSSIYYWRQRLARDTGASFVWQYPAGTTFGEVLFVTDPDGSDHTFELRTRTRSEKGWTMNAFRPFTTQAELAARVKQLVPDWQKKPELVKIVKGESDVEEAAWRVVNPHDLVTFDATALETSMPAIDHKLVRKLLDTPFKSALGQHWKTGKDGTDCFAPTTNADFHIVPKGYQGGYVEVSSKSCMRCHDSTLKHARDFQGLRDWYGRVRGSDKIFSFHIFEPGSISYNGFGNNPSLRQDLVDAGLLKLWEE
ncbi:MAG: hypothetical protein FJ271_27015 [Planctomycetes bacterium]|nr:hypothetical protein [Planctomycetota bacterium]